MDWLKNELTKIELVRRNAVLLASLSVLISLFPVQTDEINLVGARFSSDVLVFGLFHALVFYTAVLITRSLIHVLLTRSDRRRFDESVEASLRDLAERYERRIAITQDEIRSSEQDLAALNQGNDQEREQAVHSQIADARAEQVRLQEKLSQQELELRMLEPTIQPAKETESPEKQMVRHSHKISSGPFAPTIVNHPFALSSGGSLGGAAIGSANPSGIIYMPQDIQSQAPARAVLLSEIQQNKERLDELDALLSSAGDEYAGLQRMKSKRIADSRAVRGQLQALARKLQKQRNHRSKQIERERPFATLLSAYIVIGEYVFPILFGSAAAIMLYAFQEPAMLWELRPPGSPQP